MIRCLGFILKKYTAKPWQVQATMMPLPIAGTLWAPAENPWRSTSQCSLYVTSQAGSASHRSSTVGSAVTHNSCSLSVWINHLVIPVSSVARTEARLRRDSDEVKKVWFVWLRVVAVVHLSQEDHPS